MENDRRKPEMEVIENRSLVLHPDDTPSMAAVQGGPVENGYRFYPDRDAVTMVGFRNGRSNIYVLDKLRRLRWRSSGKLTRRRGNQLLRFILRLTRQQ